jgi:hypothetical protein
MRERLSFPLPDHRKAPMTEITPEIRFNTARWLWMYDVRISPTNTMREIREVVRKATYAESFPSSYTTEMVEASEALMRLFARTASPIIDSEFTSATVRVMAATQKRGGLR